MERRKRIMLLVPSLMGGGQERIAAGTARKLRTDYDVIFVVFNGENAKYDPGVPIVDLRLPALSGRFNKLRNFLRRVRTLRRLKRSEGIDVSLSFGSTANLANAFSRRSERLLVSVHGYGSLADCGLGRRLNRMIYRRADLTLCVSNRMRADLAARYRLPDNKVRTLYNAYDFEEIRRLAEEPLQDFEFPFPTLVAAGRLTPVKGYGHMLRAFVMVAQRYPQARLLLLGEGECSAQLCALAAELGIEAQVTFAGFQKNPYQYMKRAHLFVLTSQSEGFPNVMAEAMACGLPVVSADCATGPREILSAGDWSKEASGVEYADYGVLVPPMRPDHFRAEPPDDCERQFAEAALTLLGDDKLRADYAARALERSAAFGYDRYCETLKRMVEACD